MQTVNKKIVSYKNGNYTEKDDITVVESPLAVKVNGRQVYYCMRMPGMDRELAVGICYNDGRLKDYESMKSVEQIDNNTVNISMIESGNEESEELKIIRSSSGVIKKNEFEKIQKNISDSDNSFLQAHQIFDIQKDFYGRQKIFNITGATHAAALYGVHGEHLIFAEDVGRHNALDKCSGRLILDKAEKKSYICMLSSRLSYEMVLKAVKTGISLIAGASAPTALAVNLAEDNGVTLIGFLREGRFNIYTGAFRLKK